MEVIDLIQQMEPHIKLICSKMCRRQGYSSNYNLVLSATMNSKYVGAIKAGKIPTILINAEAIIPLMKEDKTGKGIQLKYVLGQLLEKAEKMQHTLSITPIANRIALPFEGKRFVKDPKKIFSINRSSISLTFVVIATNKKTGNSIEYSTASYNNVEECARLAVEKLARTDELIEETIIKEEEVIKPINPNDIKYGSVVFEHTEVNGVKLTYDIDENEPTPK